MDDDGLKIGISVLTQMGYQEQESRSVLKKIAEAEASCPKEVPRKKVGRKIQKDVAPTDLKSVCLMLGPLRNLTTMTAAVIAFHPTCQSVYHGWNGEESLGWILDGDIRGFNSFVDYLIGKSVESTKAATIGGGGVFETHAFFRPAIENVRPLEVYKSRYGEGYMKSKVECVLWKEPTYMTNFLRQNSVNFKELFRWNSSIRFLLPIRNPLDCAVRNSDLSFNRHYPSVPSPDRKQFLKLILEDLLWFLGLHARFPDCFFYFFEDEFGGPLLSRLAKFLRIKNDRRWREDVLACFKVRTSSLDHDKLFVSQYEASLESFDGYPEVSKKLKGWR